MDICSLPQDIQVNFLLNLDPKDLIRYTSSCKPLYELGSSHDFLADYVYRKYGLNIDLIPSESHWEAFTLLYELLDDVSKLEVEVEEYWDPHDNAEDDQYIINPNVGKLVLRAINIQYPRLVELVLGNIFDNLNWKHNIGNIHWLKEAFNTSDKYSDGLDMILVKNMLLVYYEPDDIIDYLVNINNPALSGEMESYVTTHPELSWIIMKNHGSKLSKDITDLLWEYIPQTKRYNRRDPIPYYQGRVLTVRTYARHRTDLLDEYLAEIDKIKQYIRYDLRDDSQI